MAVSALRGAVVPPPPGPDTGQLRPRTRICQRTDVADVLQGRARFSVGDLTATGVPSDGAEGAVCADAVFFATDRVAVFAELTRVLRPGARFLFTADESDTDRPSSVPDWAPLIEGRRLDRRRP